MTPYRRPSEIGGFTLIEVLIALVIAAVGLLGLAKMQALAVSSSKESGSRGLMALQVSSLAATLYSNHAYWATATQARKLTMLEDNVTPVNGGGTWGRYSAADATACSTKCTAETLAGVDLRNWARDMSRQFPTYNAELTCTAITATTPVNCKILVQWEEKQVAVNAPASAAPSLGVAPKPTFSVDIQP